MTIHDSRLDRLAALLAEWRRDDIEQSERQMHLRNGVGGLNGSVRLTSATVVNDRFVDTLEGGSDLDWFWAQIGSGVVDILTDRTDEETVN